MTEDETNQTELEKFLHTPVREWIKEYESEEYQLKMKLKMKKETEEMRKKARAAYEIITPLCDAYIEQIFDRMDRELLKYRKSQENHTSNTSTPDIDEIIQGASTKKLFNYLNEDSFKDTLKEKLYRTLLNNYKILDEPNKQRIEVVLELINDLEYSGISNFYSKMAPNQSIREHLQKYAHGNLDFRSKALLELILCVDFGKIEKEIVANSVKINKPLDYTKFKDYIYLRQSKLEGEEIFDKINYLKIVLLYHREDIDTKRLREFKLKADALLSLREIICKYNDILTEAQYRIAEEMPDEEGEENLSKSDKAFLKILMLDMKIEG